MGLRVAALVAYALFLGALSMPTVDHGDGEGAALVFLAFVVIHPALGFAIGRWWALLVPVAFGAIMIVAAEEFIQEAFVLVVVWPVAEGLTAVGVLAGRRDGRWRAPLTAALLAAGLIGPAVALVEWLRRGPPVPQAVQGALPVRMPLTLLCTRVDEEWARRGRDQAETLLRELRLHPQGTVTLTEYYSHYNDEVEVTVRDLAEKRLDELEAKGADCAPRLQARLRAALD